MANAQAPITNEKAELSGELQSQESQKIATESTEDTEKFLFPALYLTFNMLSVAISL